MVLALHPPAGEERSPATWDSTRLAVAVGSLGLLLVGTIGWIVGSAPAEDAGFVLFALVGFGAASTTAARRWNLPVLAFSAPLGLTFVILVGFVLVEARAWSAGVAVFVIAVVAAACLHVWEVARNLRARSALQRHREHHRHLQLHQAAVGEGATSTQPEAASLGARASRGYPVIVGLALSAGGLTLCIVGALSQHDFVPHGPRALLGALPPEWYLGIACVIAAVIVGLIASAWAAAVSVVALQLAVTLTPALVYSLPRYSWTYKHIGVVEYIIAHGSVNAHIDIYQAWPGLFAGVAWICHAIGMQNPTAVARWWPPVIDVATVLVFQRLATRVLRSPRRAWLAAAVLVVGNMIGQDYFSPQAAGFLLAIGVFAVAYRRRDEPRGMRASEWILVVAMIVAAAISHQLTPYMVAAATVVLVVFGLCRSRLIPPIAVVSAGGWALLHISTVKRYFNFSQFGDLTTNVLSRGILTRSVHKSTLIHADSYAMAADALLIGVVALVVLAQRRTKVHLALALCAASGAGLLLANSYGNEGIFRVVLFSLPWLALLCADWRASTPRRWVPVALLPVLLVAYLFADFGLDFMNAVRPGDLQATETFERSAPPRSVLYVLGNGYLPVRASPRYNLLTFRTYPYIVFARRHAPGQALRFNATTSYDEFMLSAVPRASKRLRVHRVYVLAASAPRAAEQEFGLATASQYDALAGEFLHSDQWRLVQRTATADLFELVSFIGNRRLPVINGAAQDGQRLTVYRGTWPSLNPLHFAYQWDLCDATGKQCAPIPGATRPAFKLLAPEVGHRVTVVVRATDAKGRSLELTTAASAVVGTSPPPRSVSPPTVLGQASDGGELRARVGKWESPDKLKFDYQWQVCQAVSSGCTPIPRATRSYLKLQSDLVGRFVSVIVTAVDQSDGSSTQASSAPVGPIAPATAASAQP